MALINKLTDLGDAVRERSGLTNKLTLDEMADVVRNIPQPDLTPYATIEYVDEQIETIELTPGPAGKDGQDYVLTEEDKQEIADMVPAADVDLSGYYTKEEIDDMLANLPVGEALEACEGVIF